MESAKCAVFSEFPEAVITDLSAEWSCRQKIWILQNKSGNVNLVPKALMGTEECVFGLKNAGFTEIQKQFCGSCKNIIFCLK